VRDANVVREIRVWCTIDVHLHLSGEDDGAGCRVAKHLDDFNLVVLENQMSIASHVTCTWPAPTWAASTFSVNAYTRVSDRPAADSEPNARMNRE